MVGSGLPRYAVLKDTSTQKYVLHKDDGSLAVSLESALSPRYKFELEPSRTVKGLLNIRSCYNNKYWMNNSPNTLLIVAGAASPNEDVSQWSCTLFRPVSVADDGKTITLYHISDNFERVTAKEYPPHELALLGGLKLGVTFKVINWESLLVLPKYVVFKSFSNGLYLSARFINGKCYLKFDSNDIGSEEVVHEVISNPDGSVRFKSDYFNRLWRGSPGRWILADSSPWSDSDSDSDSDPDPGSDFYSDSDDDDTWFMPVKVGSSNIVALRNISSDYFCKRLTDEGLTSCLSAYASTIEHEAKLVVEEPVFSRTIFNVDFRLADSRIYDQNVITMVTRDATNLSSESEIVQLRLNYTHTTSSTWDRSLSLKLGVSTTLKAGIPFIADGKISVSAEFDGSYSWGEKQESSMEIETTQTVIVPPMSRVRVSLIATKGKCDVPYSYSQADVLTSGKEVIQQMDDGLYTGISTYNFKYETVNKTMHCCADEVKATVLPAKTVHSFFDFFPSWASSQTVRSFLVCSFVGVLLVSFGLRRDLM